VLELITTKCLPCLMYGLDACYLSKSQLNSLDFVVNRLFMKLFQTNNIDNVRYCQWCFDFEMPSDLWVKCTNKLNEKCSYCGNMFVNSN